jgi:hypothetical protein
MICLSYRMNNGYDLYPIHFWIVDRSRSSRSNIARTGLPMQSRWSAATTGGSVWTGDHQHVIYSMIYAPSDHFQA